MFEFEACEVLKAKEYRNSFCKVFLKTNKKHNRHDWLQDKRNSLPRVFGEEIGHYRQTLFNRINKQFAFCEIKDSPHYFFG